LIDFIKLTQPSLQVVCMLFTNAGQQLKFSVAIRLMI